MPQAVHLLGVVDEVLERQVVVQGPEMLGRDLDVLQHALADGHARHDDDEFLKAVAAGQLENRPQVDVGLAGAGLHLDREMRAGAGRVGGRVEQLPRLQGRRPCRRSRCRCGAWTVRALASSLSGASSRLLPTPSSRPGLAGEQPAPVAHLDDGKFGRALRLAVEQVGDGGHGVKLVLSGWRRIAVSSWASLTPS